MGVRLPSVASTTILASVPATGAETVIATSPPINISLDFAQVLIWWYVNTGSGATTTAITARIRRGTTLAGALVNIASAVLVTAAAGSELTGCYPDTPGAVAEQQYSLTLSGTGTTGAMTTSDVAIIVFML